ncbi:helix-turn-helix domain-containing protein [Streptomyces sp. NPDC090022]|uniref:helix-turn-helix domain-containing protein n=1 Tax=Streptomyces sp. NPDC090022 TaxID=3365920 RepID=UPI003807057D
MVIGNHLAQHGELSATAIGLAVYIQSVPDGTGVGIKDLAEVFPESEQRLAAALRELEAYGYLERIREKLPTGRLVTRTVSYNRPRGAQEAPAVQAPAPEPAQAPAVQAPAPAPAPEPAEPAAAVAPAVPPPSPEAGPVPEQGPAPDPEPERQADPAPEADPAPGAVPEADPTAEAVPGAEAAARDSALRRAAADLLAGLRGLDARLLLSVRDVERLTPGVAAWLERGVDADGVRRSLTADLPPYLRSPAGFLAHRLTALLPPRIPLAPPRPAFRPPDPFQTCDGCERAYRASAPGGRCGDCRRRGRSPADRPGDG